MPGAYVNAPLLASAEDIHRLRQDLALIQVFPTIQSPDFCYDTCATIKAAAQNIVGTTPLIKQ
jgi:hypothetical protein